MMCAAEVRGEGELETVPESCIREEGWSLGNGFYEQAAAVKGPGR
jgi:hypothetical protein